MADKKFKRIVKFKPTNRQRKRKIKEWSKITPETRLLLKKLNNKKVALLFRKKYGKKILKLPPKNQLILFPEIWKWPYGIKLDRWYCRFFCYKPQRRLYRVRKNQADLTTTEWLRFICAIDSVMASGVPPSYYEFVAIHVQAFHNTWGAHRHSNFLPWHREFLIRLEDRLRLFNPLVTIPYWNWAQSRAIPSEMSRSADMTRWGITRRSTLSRPLPTQIQVDNVMASTTYHEFRDSLEGIHDTVHVAVGSPDHAMITAASPADPLFWLHHAFVDKVWADWQKINSDRPTNLTDTLQPPPLMQRTVEQTMSTENMGYVYE